MRGLGKSLAHLFLSHAQSLKPVKLNEHFANFDDKELVIDSKFMAAVGAAMLAPRPGMPQPVCR